VRLKNGSRIKRFRKPERSDADETLLKLFQQQRTDIVPVSAYVLIIKSRGISEEVK
jgi:hypothetical protein